MKEEFRFVYGPHETVQDHKTAQDAYEAARRWASELPIDGPAWVTITSPDRTIPVQIMVSKAEP
jgi:hypothetical protein